jgi:hypothetical protein
MISVLTASSAMPSGFWFSGWFGMGWKVYCSSRTTWHFLTRRLAGLRKAINI